jgi:hypothetical protein
MLKTSLHTLAFAVAATAAAASSPAATAQTFPVNLWDTCPVNNPSLGEFGSCVHNLTTSGVLSIGSTSLPIDKPIILNGGVEYLNGSPLYDAVGGPTLTAPPGNVPGGLLGIVNPAPDWPFPLWVAFWSIVNSVNGVTAVMEPVGQIDTVFTNALFPPTDGSDPVAVVLKLRVKLNNPFLGGTCYIGSAQNPLVVRLQVAPTNPPPPNQPIAGDPGVYHEVITNPDTFEGYTWVEGVSMVDNSFAVPAAKGCGNVALGLPILTPLLDFLVSGAVNLKVGLPSASGKNTAIMNGDTYLALASTVLAHR